MYLKVWFEIPLIWPSESRTIVRTIFLAKILGKTAQPLKGNQLYEKFQSGFRQYLSTESVFIRVTNYILRPADTGECAILILLALSVDLDTVDHWLIDSSTESILILYSLRVV